MNRLILIGNGFDLAHGLNTKYSDFINNYWEKIIDLFLNQSVDFENKELVIKNPLKDYDMSTKQFVDFQKFLQKHHSEIKFKNRFIGSISSKLSLNNWVDLEDEYYRQVKNIAKHKNPLYNDIKTLNQDFNIVKNYLIDYIKEIIPKHSFQGFDNIRKIIFSNFIFKEITETAITKYIEDISKPYISTRMIVNYANYGDNKEKEFDRIFGRGDKLIARDFLVNQDPETILDINPQNILMLNFNYTDTEKWYTKEHECFSGRIIKPEVIHIHGELNNSKNPIIFGYGDELDESYKAIENLNNNDYLENVKSIRYLETSNYKRLLQYINSDLYQVFIFGHSCGNSDRTLLNTIFEHDNCASIKVFYHQIDENSDNYSDVVRNISRNFNDKVKMRDRVVNKEFCEPLIKINN